MLVSVVFPSDFVFFSLPKIIISMLRKKGGQTSRPLSLSLCNHHHHHHGRHQWWPSSLNECTWLTITLHYTRLDRLQTAADQCRLCVFWLSRSVSGHDLCPFFSSIWPWPLWIMIMVVVAWKRERMADWPLHTYGTCC